MSDEGKELPPPSLGRALINLLPLIIVTFYICNYSPTKSPEYQLKQCGSSLHEIGVALEKDRLLSEEKLYSRDLKAVFGQKDLPECPVGGDESYLQGFEVAEDRESYVLTCHGSHHTEADVPSDYPRIGFSIQEAQGNGNSGEPEKEEGPQEDKEAEEVQPVQESPTPGATPNSDRESEG